jgi:hypothetical protein
MFPDSIVHRYKLINPSHKRISDGYFTEFLIVFYLAIRVLGQWFALECHEIQSCSQAETS